MNEPKNTDFFPETREQDEKSAAPEIYQSYQETDEDHFHEEHLKNLEAQIEEKFGSQISDDELGELPYDAEADQKRWNELEKDFDRVFDEAEKR